MRTRKSKRSQDENGEVEEEEAKEPSDDEEVKDRVDDHGRVRSWFTKSQFLGFLEQCYNYNATSAIARRSSVKMPNRTQTHIQISLSVSVCRICRQLLTVYKMVNTNRQRLPATAESTITDFVDQRNISDHWTPELIDNFWTSVEDLAETSGLVELQPLLHQLQSILYPEIHHFRDCVPCRRLLETQEDRLSVETWNALGLFLYNTCFKLQKSLTNMFPYSKPYPSLDEMVDKIVACSSGGVCPDCLGRDKYENLRQLWGTRIGLIAKNRSADEVLNDEPIDPGLGEDNPHVDAVVAPAAQDEQVEVADQVGDRVDHNENDPYAYDGDQDVVGAVRAVVDIVADVPHKLLMQILQHEQPHYDQNTRKHQDQPEQQQQSLDDMEDLVIISEQEEEIILPLAEPKQQPEQQEQHEQPHDDQIIPQQAEQQEHEDEYDLSVLMDLAIPNQVPEEVEQSDTRLNQISSQIKELDRSLIQSLQTQPEAEIVPSVGCTTRRSKRIAEISRGNARKKTKLVTQHINPDKKTKLSSVRDEEDAPFTMPIIFEQTNGKVESTTESHQRRPIPEASSNPPPLKTVQETEKKTRTKKVKFALDRVEEEASLKMPVFIPLPKDFPRIPHKVKTQESMPSSSGHAESSTSQKRDDKPLTRSREQAKKTAWKTPKRLSNEEIEQQAQRRDQMLQADAAMKHWESTLQQQDFNVKTRSGSVPLDYLPMDRASREQRRLALRMESSVKTFKEDKIIVGTLAKSKSNAPIEYLGWGSWISEEVGSISKTEDHLMPKAPKSYARVEAETELFELSTFKHYYPRVYRFLTGEELERIPDEAIKTYIQQTTQMFRQVAVMVSVPHLKARRRIIMIHRGFLKYTNLKYLCISKFPNETF